MVKLTLQNILFVVVLLTCSSDALAQGSRRSRIRFDETTFSVRGAIGSGVHPHAEEHGLGVSLQVDASGGPMMVWRVRRADEIAFLTLMVELGYTYGLEEMQALDEKRSGHFGTIGLVGGLVFDVPLSLQVFSCFLVGKYWDDQSFGVRTGARLNILPYLGFEVSHQWITHPDPSGSHAIRFTLLIDFGIMIHAMFHPANYAG